MDSSAQAILADVDRSTSELVGVLRRCSRRSLEWFRRPVEVENKLGSSKKDSNSVGFDPVTTADRVVEDLLREFLSQRFPTVGIYGEERGKVGSDTFRWIIDPIDGTRAFVTGRPMWGTLLGLEIESVPVAGFMHIPTLDESYWAITNPDDDTADQVSQRARFWSPLMEKDLASSTTTDVSQACLASTHPTMFETDDEQARFAAVAEQCQLVRYDGDCYNYGLLASGDIDIVVENQLQPYDIAPLIPLVEAAGGIITDLQGNSARSGGFVVASANEKLHTQVLGLMSD